MRSSPGRKLPKGKFRGSCCFQGMSLSRQTSHVISLYLYSSSVAAIGSRSTLFETTILASFTTPLLSRQIFDRLFAEASNHFEIALAVSLQSRSKFRRRFVGTRQLESEYPTLLIGACSKILSINLFSTKKCVGRSFQSRHIVRSSSSIVKHGNAQLRSPPRNWTKASPMIYFDSLARLPGGTRPLYSTIRAQSQSRHSSLSRNSRHSGMEGTRLNSRSLIDGSLPPYLRFLVVWYPRALSSNVIDSTHDSGVLHPPGILFQSY